MGQPDSIIPDPHNPLDFDRYAYARSNPIRYNDPSGHIPCYGTQAGECSWSGTEHHHLSTKGRRREIATYTDFVLREVRNPAKGVDDVEALARVMNFAAGYDTSAQEWADDLSSVLLDATGTTTLVKGVYLKAIEFLGFTSLNLPEFGDTGFNLVYQDGQNQPYHWWGYVNTTAQGGFWGLLLAIFANVTHEFFDPTEIFNGGSSWEDYGLSDNGMFFGLMLYNGKVTPDTAADYVRHLLRTDIRRTTVRNGAQQIGNSLLLPNLPGSLLDKVFGR